MVPARSAVYEQREAGGRCSDQDAHPGHSDHKMIRVFDS